MMNRLTKNSVVLLAALLPVGVAAQQYQIVHYSSGTGFFVDRDGHILTNEHVVQRCQQITVRGAVSETPATLVTADASNDLALLKTDVIAPDAAAFRAANFPAEKDEPVVIVGYPGQQGLTTRDSKILATKGPTGEAKWIQFSDAVAHGNSGGPLLDAGGNVVGVVVAKATLMTYNTTGARNETISNSDLAISLPVARAFLEDNGVRLREGLPAGQLASHRVEDRVRGYIVNVQCRQ